MVSLIFSSWVLLLSWGATPSRLLPWWSPATDSMGESPPGACFCFASPWPLPAPGLSYRHTLSASFLTSPLPGPCPVCELQPQQLASPERRANIYSSSAHPGPHRRTKDWCEPRGTKTEGEACSSIRRQGWGRGVLAFLLFMLSSGLPASF